MTEWDSFYLLVSCVILCNILYRHTFGSCVWASIVNNCDINQFLMWYYRSIGIQAAGIACTYNRSDRTSSALSQTQTINMHEKQENIFAFTPIPHRILSWARLAHCTFLIVCYDDILSIVRAWQFDGIATGWFACWRVVGLHRFLDSIQKYLQFQSTNLTYTHAIAKHQSRHEI